jgi:transcriptional regulator with XRE-family HTH domain
MKRITQRTIAERLKLGRPYLSEMLAGKRRPSPKVAMRLERMTGINTRIWLYGKCSEIRSEIENFFKKKINFGRGNIPRKEKQA